MDSQGLGKAFHGAEHYENFPVGSWLVPKPMRPAVLALYRFARTGDDLADEGDRSIDERHAGLEALSEGLENRDCEHPLAMTKAIGANLRAELDARSIPIAPALALLSAFRQDVHNPDLHTEHDVLDYCSRSANPIGQLVLAFAGLTNLEINGCALVQKSDAICTGLQLANFAQDMGQDFSRGRMYVPLSWGETEALHGSPRPLSRPRDNGLVTKMARWAQGFLAQGEGLPKSIRRHPSHPSLRLALEIALTLQGGKAICHKVLKKPGLVWEKSPRLSKKDLPVLLLRSLTAVY